MIKAVFFDLDGTLVNSLRDIAAAMNGALAAFGLPGFSPEEYRHKVGNGARILAQRCLPEERLSEADALRQEYGRRYLADCCVETCPYEGVVPSWTPCGRRGCSWPSSPISPRIRQTG